MFRAFSRAVASWSRNLVEAQGTGPSLLALYLLISGFMITRVRPFLSVSSGCAHASLITRPTFPVGGSGFTGPIPCVRPCPIISRRHAIDAIAVIVTIMMITITITIMRSASHPS